MIYKTSLYVSHVIVINDGSTDATEAELADLSSQYPHIKIISLEKNRGKGFALLEGFRYAFTHIEFDILITLDGDAQHQPEDIPTLIQAIQESADMAIAARQFHFMPPKNKFGNSFIFNVLKHFYPHAPYDTQSGFRAFKKHMIEKITDSIQGGHFETEFEILLLALRGNHKIKSIPIKTIYIDKNKSSHFSPIKDSFIILKSLWKHR